MFFNFSKKYVGILSPVVPARQLNAAEHVVAMAGLQINFVTYICVTRAATPVPPSTLI